MPAKLPPSKAAKGRPPPAKHAPRAAHPPAYAPPPAKHAPPPAKYAPTPVYPPAYVPPPQPQMMQSYPPPVPQQQIPSNVTIVTAGAPVAQTIVVEKKEVNHLLHFLITLVFWPWIIVWIILCLSKT